MDEPRMDNIMQVGCGFFASKTLLSAVELELFTELAKHPETLTELSARLGLHARSARDFLDALVALNFLERRDGTYYNTPSTDLFLDKRKPSFIGGVLEMANQRLYPFWSHLTIALRTGEPQNELRSGDTNPFKLLYADPERLRSFLRAMTGISHGANLAIAKKFPWANYKSAVDVGTAQAISSPRSRSPIRTSPASASTCLRSAPSLRITSRPTTCHAASSFARAAFGTHPSPRPTWS